MKYIPVIGLEIHIELKTKSKMFCQCSVDYFGKAPNTNTCPVCLGLPGALPVPNKTAIEWTIKFAEALSCKIANTIHFDRKHYFYPDLPKGYQISQYDEPIGTNGSVEYYVVNPATKRYEKKKINLTRIHLEEDTGKLMHKENESVVDFNRSGVPLVELVTNPEFHSSEDVKSFLEELYTIIRYLDISDADMEKGSMRMEPNVSLLTRRDEQSKMTLPPYKVEVKNINSFRFVKQAIDYELKRQQKILEDGKIPIQETRGFDEKKQITYPQRAKEEAHDYRYFPEPDIPPITIASCTSNRLGRLRLPMDYVQDFIDNYHLPYEDAFRLTREKWMADFFEKMVNIRNENVFIQSKQKSTQTVIAHTTLDTDAQKIASLLVNKKIFVTRESNIENVIKQIDELLIQYVVTDEELTLIIGEVLGDVRNQSLIDSYQSGKVQAIHPLLGKVLQKIGKKTDAVRVRKELENRLKSKK